MWMKHGQLQDQQPDGHLESRFEIYPLDDLDLMRAPKILPSCQSDGCHLYYSTGSTLSSTKG